MTSKEYHYDMFRMSHKGLSHSNAYSFPVRARPIPLIVKLKGDCVFPTSKLSDCCPKPLVAETLTERG